MKNRAKLKKLIVNIIVFLFSFTVWACVLEFSYRFFLFGWDSLSITKMKSVHTLGTSGLIQASQYTEIVYELKPNLRTYFKLTRFETNTQGLRDQEYELKKPSNTFRIAVVGDSYTMPAGVSIEDAYHTLLEEKFNATQTHTMYEFINFGVGGYDLRQYVGVIKYKAIKYSPNMILIGFCARNDCLIRDAQFFKRPYRALKQKHAFFRSFAFSDLMRLFKPRPHADTNQIIQIHPSEEEEKYMQALISELGSFSRQNNIPVVVAYLDNRPVQCNVLEHLITQNKLHFINCSLQFLHTNFSDYVIYVNDSHPNKKANRIFADSLYEYLTINKLVGENQ